VAWHGMLKKGVLDLTWGGMAWHGMHKKGVLDLTWHACQHAMACMPFVENDGTSH